MERLTPEAGAHLHERRRGKAQRRQGWVGGVYPSAPFPARTAASDGHTAFTRAARSAGLRFAVILLSKAIDVGRDHLIHRKRSPFPEKTGRSEELGVRSYCARYLKTRSHYRARLLPTAYCLLPIAYCLLPFNHSLFFTQTPKLSYNLIRTTTRETAN